MDSGFNGLALRVGLRQFPGAGHRMSAILDRSHSPVRPARERATMHQIRRSGLTRRRLLPLAAAALLPQIARARQEATPFAGDHARPDLLVDPVRLAEAIDAGAMPPVVVAFMPEAEVA